jgi:hypothetical protein
MPPKVKLEVKTRLVPEGIDLTDLKYLQRGDVVRVADSLGVHPNYVSRVRSLKSYSVKVLSALLKKGAENRKLLTQQ